jgi:nitrate reductase beta subunit
LRLKGGGTIRKLLTIFANPDLPSIDDYGEPWTYDYERLFTAPVSERDPVARARSRLTGKPISLQWGSNWEDDLAGAPQTAPGDPNLRGIEDKVRFEYEQAFMFYLPRICEHCLNPSCVASCPSGAMYKREEDGIVLVDQDGCRGWRFCVSGCPYKKVYFNHKSGKAEKCTFCYPRIENGQPTICSETCVGRLRYLGLVLYDADRVEAAASVRDPAHLRQAQLDLFLDPSDPAVVAEARRSGIPDDWVAAAQRSPIYALAVRYGLALPLHPEFRTLPMVWYVPPLSPVLDALAEDEEERSPDLVFHAIDRLRIPVEYLANLLTAGDADAVRVVLRRLAAVRTYMRAVQLTGEADPTIANAVGLAPDDLDALYRLLAIAPYADRYVIPPAHAERAARLEESVSTGCSVDYEDQFRESAAGYRTDFVDLQPRGSARAGPPPTAEATPGPRLPQFTWREPSDEGAAS